MAPLKHQSKTIPSKRSASPLVGQRQSQRLKSTTKRGSNFVSAPSGSESENDDSDPGYESEEESTISSSVATDREEEDESTSGNGSMQNARSNKRSGKSSISIGSRKGQELWREGVKSDLQPGQEVYVKLPKARKAGNVTYRDDTVHPNTLLFLGDLKSHNEREWLKIHDADYRQSQKDFNSFVESLTAKIIDQDETIPELPPKDLVFRIYRDVRFSNDPTPYKTHFSAAWSRTGRKGPYAAYYLQIAPGSSFVGGGLWHPEAAPLALLRRDVDRRSHKLKKVLNNPSIRLEFLGRTGNDFHKAVKAFVAHNSENALKRKPKGYEDDNPNINLLRLKNYTLGCKIDDKEVLGLQGLNRIADLMAILTPFVSYLNSVVMPDNSDIEDDDGNDSEGNL